MWGSLRLAPIMRYIYALCIAHNIMRSNVAHVLSFGVDLTLTSGLQRCRVKLCRLKCINDHAASLFNALLNLIFNGSIDNVVYILYF